MVALIVYVKKVKIFFFFIMPNLTTTEVISVANSLDRDHIYTFLKHFVPSKIFPFPKEYIV